LLWGEHSRPHRRFSAWCGVQDSAHLHAGRRGIYDPDHYSLLSEVPTVLGGRTAGYFGRQGKGFDRFYLAIPASSSAGAEVRIYTVQD